MSINIYCMADFGSFEPSVKKLTKRILEDSFKDNNPCCLCLLGDNFYDRGVKDKEGEEWEAFDSIFSNFNNNNIPIYAVLGNHDYLGNIHGQVGNHRWNMPNYYHFQKLDDLSLGLWFLDTQILSPEDDGGEYHDMRGHVQKQIGDWKLEKKKHWEWLEKTLEENSHLQYKFLFGHFPIVSQGAYEGREGMDELYDLIERYNATAYVSGHDHNSQHMIYRHPNHLRINQLICAATIRHATYGDENNEKAIGKREGVEGGFFSEELSFLKIQIDYENEKCRFYFINENGEEIYQYRIKYSSNRCSPK